MRAMKHEKEICLKIIFINSELSYRESKTVRNLWNSKPLQYHNNIHVRVL